MALASRLPRHEEWHSSIVAAANVPKYKLNDNIKSVLTDLSNRINVPRTDIGFKEQMMKSYPHLKPSDILYMWDSINKYDKILHAIEFDSIQDKDKSVATILSNELKMNLYHVHR